MIISNEQTVKSIGMRFSIAIILLSLIFLSSIIFDALQLWWLQYPSAGLIILTVLLFRFGGFHYILANISENTLEIKFYNIFPYKRKFRLIKISAAHIHKIKIRKGIWGIGKGLILFQNTGKTIAKYPFIGLSALNAENYNKILLHINKKK